MKLSPQALNLLWQLFNEQSNLSVPAGFAAQVIEIRQWVVSQAQPPALSVPDESKKKAKG